MGLLACMVIVGVALIALGMADVGFNGTQVLFVDGKVQFGCDCCCDCTDDLPSSITATVTGVDPPSSCITRRGDCPGSPESYTIAQKITAAVIGTHTLTRDSLNPCRWDAVIPAGWISGENYHDCGCATLISADGPLDAKIIATYNKTTGNWKVIITYFDFPSSGNGSFFTGTAHASCALPAGGISNSINAGKGLGLASLSDGNDWDVWATNGTVTLS